MKTTTPAQNSLYTGHRGSVDFIDVPELAYLGVTGHGAPESTDFAAAVQALYAVSYGAHFLLKRAFGQAPRVMPLEALWWLVEPDEESVVEAFAVDHGLAGADRDRWHWRAMIMQPDPLDEPTVSEAMSRARAKDLPALDHLVFERWAEGACAQLLHVGPYSTEGPSIERLHAAIRTAGRQPRGHHHEIYLGDPRRSAPERLRTIVRQPCGPA
jgi:hypothetical protein